MDKTHIYGVKPIVDKIISDGGSEIITIHLYAGDQNLLDDSHPDIRRARVVVINMIIG